MDGAIANGIREQIQFSFKLLLLLAAPPALKIIKEPTTVLYKTRLRKIKCFLEDSNQNPVDFINESLTFNFQSIKI